MAERNWTVLAVDPGACPTACVLWNRGKSVRFYDRKDLSSYIRSPDSVAVGKKNHRKGASALQFDARKMSTVMEWANPDLVVVEAVWVRPGQGVASQAKLVYVMGACVGLAAGIGASLLFLRPQTWTKAHGLQTRDPRYSGKLRKTNRVAAALELEPEMLAGMMTRKIDHNRADAFLMAHLGMQMLREQYQHAVGAGASTAWRPGFWIMR